MENIRTLDKLFNFPDFTFLICLGKEGWEKVYCVAIKFVKTCGTQHLLNKFVSLLHRRDIYGLKDST